MSADHDPNLKGNVAELKIAAEAARLGIDVLRPMTEHCRYDLVFEIGGELKRVQCKWASLRGDVVVIRLVSSRRGATGFIRTRYSADEVDAVAAYCAAVDGYYYVPIERCGNMTEFSLRVAPTRNGQRASINFASDYILGAVAQLEVAPPWHGGGRGFESLQLHSPERRAEPTVLGAHDYRNRFGCYMERAAAGESFLITHRGKPYARLCPPSDQLDLSSRPGHIAA